MNPTVNIPYDPQEYDRLVSGFVNDDRYLRLDDQGKKEKLFEFFDQYTVPYLKEQGAEDPEKYRQQFVDKYFFQKKKDSGPDMPEVATGEGPSEDYSPKYPEYLSFPAPDIKPFVAATDAIPDMADPEILHQARLVGIDNAEKHAEDVNKAVSDVFSNDRYKYVRDNPGGFLSILNTGESDNLADYLKDQGYGKSVIKDAMRRIEAGAQNNLTASLREGKDKQQVLDEATQVGEPYVADWKEGTFLDPETGQRVSQPETDEQQDYLALVDANIMSYGPQATDKEKLAGLFGDAYLKKQYWDRHFDKVSAQISDKEPSLQKPSTKTFWDARRQKLNADAEFEAMSLMYLKNVGIADVKKKGKYNWEVFGNAMLHSLNENLDFTNDPIGQEILAKMNEVGGKEFQWTDEEKKHMQATTAEMVAQIGGSLLPDMPSLLLFGGASNILKDATMINRLKDGYRIIRNPALKNAGKAWKAVVSLNEPLQPGWEVLKEVKPSAMQKVYGTILSSLADEALFSGVGGFPVGTMTGMNLSHELMGQVKYGGKWGKILQPYIDMAVKSGVGATVGMEAGSLTAKATEALFSDEDFKSAFDQSFGDVSETSKRVIAEFLVNSIAFGGMHLLTPMSRKAMTNPVGESENWFAYYSPKYRARVLSAAREADKAGYTETAQALNTWLDLAGQPVSGKEYKEARMEEKKAQFAGNTPEKINEELEGYTMLIQALEHARNQKDFSGDIRFKAGEDEQTIQIGDRMGLLAVMEDAYETRAVLADLADHGKKPEKPAEEPAQAGQERSPAGEKTQDNEEKQPAVETTEGQGPVSEVQPEPEKKPQEKTEAPPQEEVKPQEKASQEQPGVASKDDIPEKLARQAHEFTSHSPEKRGEQVRQEYEDMMKKDYAGLGGEALNDQQKEVLNREWESYKQGVVDKYKAWLQAKSRTASPMITGPSNFPTARNEKALKTEQKRYDELVAYRDRGLASIKKKIRGEQTEEEATDQAWQQMESDIRSSAGTIKEIDQGNEPLDRSAFVNSIVGRIQRAADNGNVTLVERGLDLIKQLNSEMEKPIITNTHSLWDLADKAREKQSTKKTGQETIDQAEGVKVVNNHDAERIQLFFDEKPDEALRKKMKSEGWNWSPTNGAWQRKNTLNAENSARRITDEFFRGERPAEKPPEETQPVPEETPGEKQETEKPPEGPEKKETEVPREAAPSQDVVEFPVKDIHIDTKRFQNREEPFVEEHVKNIVENFDYKDLDPLRLWKDPKDEKVYVLAGHNRLESVKRVGRETVKAEFVEGTEKQAIEKALESNTKALKETLPERAKYYRKQRAAGKSKADIKRQAMKNEGNNAERVIDYSYLSPDGKAMEALSRFEKTGEGENTENLRNVAQYVGRARRTYPDLTDAHETEMFNFLMDPGNYSRHGTMAKFQALVDALRGMFFDPEKPLNFNKVRDRTQAEIDYENRVHELEGELRTARDNYKKKQDELDKRLEQQREQLSKGGKLPAFEVELTESKRQEILKPLQEQIDRAADNLLQFRQSEDKYREASKQELGLWAEVNESIDKNDIGYDEAHDFTSKGRTSSEIEPTVQALEKQAKDTERSGDREAAQRINEAIDKLIGNEAKEPTAKDRQSQMGYGSLDPGQKGTIDEKVQKMAREKAEQEGFVISQRVKEILGELGVPVAEKYLPKRLLGVFKHRSKNIRVQRLFDVFTAAHEATHYINDLEGITNRVIDETTKGDDLRKALTDAYQEFYPTGSRSHSLRKRMEEGIAVLLENYFYDPEYVASKYPELVDAFIKPGGRFYTEKYTKLLDAFNQLVEDYARLEPEQQIGARIVTGEEVVKKDRGFTLAQRLKYEFFNKMEPLKRYAKEGGVTGTIQDPFVHYFQWLNRNSFVYDWIKGNQRAILLPDGNWIYKKGSFSDVAKMIKNREKTFASLLVARRVVEDHNRLENLKDQMREILGLFDGDTEAAMADPDIGPQFAQMARDASKLSDIIENNNIQMQQAEATVRKYEHEFKEPLDLYDEIRRDLVEFSRNTGLISNEVAEKYLASEGYAPFFRFIEDELTSVNNGIKGSPSAQSKARMFKERKGSSLAIIDPTFNLMTSVHEVIGKGLENMLWRKVYDLSLGNTAIARRFEEVPMIVKPERDGSLSFPQDQDPNLLKVLVNGHRRYVKVAPEFAAVARNLRGQEWDVFTKIIRIPSALFTRLTTSANPLFALGNATVDQFSAFMQSKLGYKPIFDPIDSFIEMGKTLTKAHDEDPTLFQKYLLAGGKRQTFASSYEVAPEDAIARLSKKGTVDKVFNILELPSNLSEYMSRFAEFKRAKKAGRSDTEAMYMATEVTVPFQLMGNWGGKFGQNWVKSIPYFNAMMEVVYKYGRTIKEQPGLVLLANAGLMATALTSAMVTMQEATQQQRRLLANLPARELTRALFFPHPDGKRLIRIRIPEEIGGFTGLAYLYSIQHYTGQKVQFKEFTRALTASIPDQFNITQPDQMFLSWIPQVISTSFETIANLRTYPDLSPIVPQYVIDEAPPEMQYYKYTSDIAKHIGDWFGVSPAKIEYWVRNQFGVLGGAVLGKLPNNPMIRQEERHVMQGRSYNQFYENKQHFDQEYNYLDQKEGYSDEEKKEVILNHVLHGKVGDMLSNMRRTVKAGGDIPEEIREDAFSLLIRINNGESGDKIYRDIEALNKDVLDYIDEYKIDIGTVHYQVTKKEIEDSIDDTMKKYDFKGKSGGGAPGAVIRR